MLILLFYIYIVFYILLYPLHDENIPKNFCLFYNEYFYDHLYYFFVYQHYVDFQDN